MEFKREVGLFRIHDNGTRIDARFNRVALQNGEAEAVDRRSREFAQDGSRIGQRLGLSVAQRSLAKRRLEVFRHSPIDQHVSELIDPCAKFRGCALGKGNCGNARGRAPGGEQHCDPSGKE